MLTNKAIERYGYIDLKQINETMCREGTDGASELLNYAAYAIFYIQTHSEIVNECNVICNGVTLRIASAMALRAAHGMALRAAHGMHIHLRTQRVGVFFDASSRSPHGALR